jgi:hypothetical protein
VPQPAEVVLQLLKFVYLLRRYRFPVYSLNLLTLLCILLAAFEWQQLFCI